MSIWMLIAALCVIVKEEKVPKYLLMDKWIDKLRYFYTVEYKLAIKRIKY